MTLITSPLPRWSAAMAELPGTGLVLFGGKTNTNSDPPGFLNDWWLWNGTAWVFKSNSFLTTGPSARGEATMSYDGTNVVLVGGTDGQNNLSDTWSYTGSNWVLNSTTPYSAPTTIRNAAMVYQSGSSEAILFGGITSYQRHYVLDTWAWSAGSWMQLSPPAYPSGREKHAMASSSSTLVLFGGFNFNGALSDTYTFNSTTWSNVAVSGPSARYGAVMAYDLMNTQWILFGGITANGFNAETWSFNGSVWSQVTPATSPAPRAYASMAYDSTNHNLMLFGGLGYDRSFGDTWVYNTVANTWSQQ